MTPSLALRAIPAALVACALTLGTAVAQTTPQPPAPQAAPQPPMPPHGMHGGRGLHMQRDLDRLKTSLKLDAKQTALWDRAVEATKPQGDWRERMKANRDRMEALIDDPNFDPRKAAAEMDRAEAERTARKKAVRESWFAVYDSLNPTQRGQAREFLRSRMSRGMHGMRDRMMMRMHGPDGMRGAPPAPPAPPAPR